MFANDELEKILEELLQGSTNRFCKKDQPGTIVVGTLLKLILSNGAGALLLF